MVEGCEWVKVLPGKLREKIMEVARKTKKIGEDDPRRIIHSLKVGLAITLVSLFYYFEPLYNGFGGSAMWAVLTVVVVFDFSVGATLGRGLNRGLATFLAALLGFGAHRLASLSGEKGEPIILAIFVFLIATITTYMRFYPRMKVRYDYGLLIFILTFCLISLSGYRDEELLETAHKRVSTILIGGFIAVSVCIFIYPVWAGNDLHNLVATNIERLASSLEGFGLEYFKLAGDIAESSGVSEAYKSVLNSRHSEESLANFARWEPGHGRFKFSHPWKQYPKVGSITRKCAYRIEALHGYQNTHTQIPEEILSEIQDPCIKVSLESAKALKELASAIRTMTPPSYAASHLEKSKIAAAHLKSLLNSGLCKEGGNLLDILPALTVSSLLVDVISSIERIAESVQELASLAKFKNAEPKEEEDEEEEEAAAASRRQILSPNVEKSQSCSNADVVVPHHVITIDQPNQSLLDKRISRSKTIV